ncbi:MAG: hypothetical protein JWN00_6011 [Actinomycetia bacterium]|nr:hypothetical protein [Actinomycetes bacterium]
MNHILFAIGSNSTAPAGYDRGGAFLYLLVGVFALLCTLLLARFRITVSAVFRRPFRERTIIARTGGRFYLYPEGEPPPDDPDDNQEKDDPEKPDPDSPGTGKPVTKARVTPPKPRGRKTGREERVRGH